MLSMHKFGSNVIEKCLQFSEKKQKDEIIQEILVAKISEDESYSSTNQVVTLTDLMKDKYGNYVIQRVIDISNDNQRKQLIDKIQKVAVHMRKHKSHARHVFNFLEKHYGINFTYSEEEEKKSSKKSNSGKERKSTQSSKAKVVVGEQALPQM